MPTRHQGTEEEKLALDVLIKLSRAADSVGNRVLFHLSGSGLSPTQFGILDALYHVGAMPLGELARRHLKSPNNITSVVDTMERSGLVVRQRHGVDRRMILLHLTEHGRDLFESHWPAHLIAVVQTMGVLTPEEQQTLARLLRKLGKGEV